jgi:hypothetical protein
MATVTCSPQETVAGQIVTLKAEPTRTAPRGRRYQYIWTLDGGSLLEQGDQQDAAEVHWDTSALVPGIYTARVTINTLTTAGQLTSDPPETAQETIIVSQIVSQPAASRQELQTVFEGAKDFISQLKGNLDTKMDNVATGVQHVADRVGNLVDRLPAPGQPTAVALQRTARPRTEDLALWVIIRRTTEAISFDNYDRFMTLLLCTPPSLSPPGAVETAFDDLRQRRFLPYNDVDAYRLLKVATEAFLMVNCGVTLAQPGFTPADLDDLLRRTGMNGGFDLPALNNLWQRYLQLVNGGPDVTLPYLALIRRKLHDIGLKNSVFAAEDPNISLPEDCFGILRRKLTNPCLLELIWSYWHEEGMLVQTLNAISRRFQNIGGPAVRDPLAMLEIDPLRPLNNLLWGYIQDEQHRLNVVRRSYEYDHHYGLRLYGKAVPEMRTADSRSKFIEAFHNMLYLCSVFYKQDDDTTVVSDGFPLLNALREVHLILSQGAHNQFGDLPSTARQEMLIQQWLLARPEFREFLPTRIMVAYPEAWMDRVDAMKTLQGWTDVAVLHFRDLGLFGEQIVLSIRFGAWNDVNDPVQAVNWARFWRAEIQRYTYSYRTVTGVDLTAEHTDTRRAADRYILPSVHLRNRLATQQRRI